MSDDLTSINIDSVETGEEMPTASPGATDQADQETTTEITEVPVAEEIVTEEPVTEVSEEPIMTTVYDDSVLIEKLDMMIDHQNNISMLLIFVIGMIAGVVFAKSLLKGWLDG